MPECLQKDDNKRHQRFHQTELQGSLFAEPQEPNGVRLSGETARPIEAGRFDGLATDFGHDVALTAKVFVAQRQEVVDDERCQ